MTLLQLLAVGLGGFFGAIARYYTSQKWNKTEEGQLPYGTLFVNLVGSFLLGYFASSSLNEIYMLLLGTGFLGAFTTFSTLNKELVMLQKLPLKWIAYFTITYVGGLSSALLGYYLGS
ncbi:fluoride efflux transporter CrcB [Psychrobacillus vulpis]|uniref:Fluoride-specific ion channel FluC n=1 Tax=Psychrobacillus vulpis TaxID=2325572 RepID=A0A544TLX0_9BACI|nr:fluoride efflux transporter CrcB [Psychrobacillus vulpis]TQR18452.1 fluoride efflux transporter CrcB [Psychrobacillus vulpis]